MYIPITIAALVLLTFAILLLRIFWLRLPARARFYLIRAAFVLIVLHVILTVTKWEINSDRLNIMVKWSAVASYELLVMLFTLMPPKRLTTVCALILLVPVFSSSIVMPLVPLFDPNTYKLKPFGVDLLYRNVPWGSVPPATSGSDLDIYYRPPLAPFLRHLVRVFIFNNQQCNAYSTFPVLQPDGKHVLARCPHWPSQGAGTDDRLSFLP